MSVESKTIWITHVYLVKSISTLSKRTPILLITGCMNLTNIVRGSDVHKSWAPFTLDQLLGSQLPTSLSKYLGNLCTWWRDSHVTNPVLNFDWHWPHWRWSTCAPFTPPKWGLAFGLLIRLIVPNPLLESVEWACVNSLYKLYTREGSSWWRYDLHLGYYRSTFPTLAL